MLYDLIIIGAGPAGMSAAIYAARQKINFLVVSLNVGGQVTWSSEVGNYPGFPILTGPALVKKFQEHLDHYKINIKRDDVEDIRRKGKVLVVKTRGSVFETKAVIIASGKKARKLGVPGEGEFKNKGVSYCATCDAPLFGGKDVAVVGGANSAMEAALFLTKYANKVYIIDIMPKLAGQKVLRDKILANKKITVITKAQVKEIFGKKFVSGLKYEKAGKEEILDVGGVFVEIGLIPGVDFIDSVKKNKSGEIMIFRSTTSHKENLTSIAGIFAAGDVTDVPVKQIVVSAGEGAKAALASFDYIERWG